MASIQLRQSILRERQPRDTYCSQRYDGTASRPLPPTAEVEEGSDSMASLPKTDFTRQSQKIIQYREMGPKTPIVEHTDAPKGSNPGKVS